MLSTPIELTKAGVEHTDALIALVKACYGNTCSEARFYTRQALFAAISRQELHIFVACLPNGQLVAMEVCEQIPHFPSTVYLKNKMTLPAYQGQGIGKQLTAYLFEQFDFSSCSSLFAFSLTYTTATQGSLYKLGATMTGLLYNSYLRVEALADSRTAHPKRSHVIMVKRLTPQPPPTLSLTPALVPLARQVYHALGTEVTALSHTLVPPTGLSSMTTVRYDDHHHTELVVNRCGSDLLNLVAAAVERDNRDPLSTCNLFLNMVGPSAAYIYHALCEKGFVFSGFLPLTPNSEYLVLYYSQGVPIPTDELVILPDFEKLREAIVTASTGNKEEIAP